MVIWFFENNQFTDAWIPFDRSNQKKLEYVYRHHEELIHFILQRQQHRSIDTAPIEDDSNSNNKKDHYQLLEQHQQQLVQTLLEKQHQYQFPVETKCPPALLKEQDKDQSTTTGGPPQNIHNIDLEEEDASIQELIKYDHNCIYINLLDSHFEQEITLYPAMLLGSLPDRDILIVRAA